MSEWFKRLIGKHTVDCFHCEDKTSKKEAFTVKLQTEDGPLDMFLCPTCAKDFDDLMLDVEAIINEQRD